MPISFHFVIDTNLFATRDTSFPGGDRLEAPRVREFLKNILSEPGFTIYIPHFLIEQESMKLDDDSGLTLGYHYYRPMLSSPEATVKVVNTPIEDFSSADGYSPSFLSKKFGKLDANALNIAHKLDIPFITLNQAMKNQLQEARGPGTTRKKYFETTKILIPDITLRVADFIGKLVEEYEGSSSNVPNPAEIPDHLILPFDKYSQTLDLKTAGFYYTEETELFIP